MAYSNGFDSAVSIVDVMASATNEFGGGSFFIRYIQPSPDAIPMTTSSAIEEARYSWTYGIRYWVFLSEPNNARYGASNAAACGTADATQFCSQILAIYETVVPLLLPVGELVHVFLGVEASVNLTSAYWNAWSQYVNAYEFAGYPSLCASLYCNPGASTANCSVATTGCYSIWANEPEPCSACGAFGSVSWGPESCYNSSVTGPTVIWQMAEPTECNACGHTLSTTIDLDMAISSELTGSQWHLSSDPPAA